MERQSRRAQHHVGGSEGSLPQGQEAGRGAAAARRPAALRAGRGERPIVRDGALPARDHLRHREGFFRAYERGGGALGQGDGRRAADDSQSPGGRQRAAEEAREYAEELVSKYPNDERAHFLLGNAYFGQQDFDKAIEQYKKAIEINAQFSGAYNSSATPIVPSKSMPTRKRRSRSTSSSFRTTRTPTTPTPSC